MAGTVSVKEVFDAGKDRMDDLNADLRGRLRMTSTALPESFQR
jgi:hypothetical protein